MFSSLSVVRSSFPQDAEAKILARKEIVAGSLKLKITKLGELLTAAGGKFLTGDKITYAE